MSIPVKGSDNATYQVQQASLGEGDKGAGVAVTLPTNGNHAKTADLAALQSALLTALGLLATDQDVMATNAKLEAIRLLLASPGLPAGAAADTSVQAITTKAEAIRALLAGTLAISATALPLPVGAAKDVTLSGAFGTAADAATPDIAATGASFSFVSLFKGMVSWLKAIAGYEAPFQGVVALPANTAGSPGRALRVNCTAAGSITLTYANGSTDTVPVNVGLSYLPGAIAMVAIPGSGGATATFANMI